MKNNKFSNINIINCEILEKMLYEECCSIIDAFSKTDDNKDVYAFSLYINEHNQIIVYLNNEIEFQSSLKVYKERNFKYNDNKEVMSLKYCVGDFRFMITPFESYFSDKFRKVYEYYQTIHWIKSEERVIEVDKLPYNEKILCAFNEEVFDYRLYGIVVNVVSRLKDKLKDLNKTDKFIAFASTGNSYIDYSIAMRKSIDIELFYNLFPNEKLNDLEFNKIINEQSNKGPREQFDFWFNETLKEDYKIGHDVYSRYLKNSYEGVRILEKNMPTNLLKDIISECILEMSVKEKAEINYKKIGFLCNILINKNEFTDEMYNFFKEQIAICKQYEQISPYNKFIVDELEELLGFF